MQPKNVQNETNSRKKSQQKYFPTIKAHTATTTTRQTTRQIHTRDRHTHTHTAGTHNTNTRSQTGRQQITRKMNKVGGGVCRAPGKRQREGRCWLVGGGEVDRCEGGGGVVRGERDKERVSQHPQASDSCSCC